MCSACGILQGTPDWVEGAGGDGGALHDRLAERRRRMALVNLLLDGSGVRLGEHGRQLVVRGATGKTRLATDLAHVWRAVDELARHLPDPLEGYGAGGSAGGGGA